MGYASIKDSIFTGPTGRELRRHPPEVRELQFYLCAGPLRDPFGLFIVEPEIAAAHLGRSAAMITKSLEILRELEFCVYDAPSQYVWVLEMAHHQFQTPLKLTDNRCLQAQRWYTAMPRNPYLGPWFDRYVDDFHLDTGTYAVSRRNGARGEGNGGGPSEGPVLNVLPPVVREGVIGESEGKEGEPIPLAQLDEAFDRIWAAYPNAVERKEARAIFSRLRPTPALVETMLEAVAAQKLGEKWRQGYIPKLPNWLEKQLWTDRIAEGPVLSPRTRSTLDAAERFVRKNKQP